MVLLTEIENRLFVNKLLMEQAYKSCHDVSADALEIEAFEKYNKFYLIKGYELLAEYMKGNPLIKDLFVEECLMYRFDKTQFVNINKIPHQISDRCQKS